MVWYNFFKHLGYIIKFTIIPRYKILFPDYICFGYSYETFGSIFEELFQNDHIIEFCFLLERNVYNRINRLLKN